MEKAALKSVRVRTMLWMLFIVYNLAAWFFACGDIYNTVTTFHPRTVTGVMPKQLEVRALALQRAGAAKGKSRPRCTLHTRSGLGGTGAALRRLLLVPTRCPRLLPTLTGRLVQLQPSCLR